MPGQQVAKKLTWLRPSSHHLQVHEAFCFEFWPSTKWYFHQDTLVGRRTDGMDNTRAAKTRSRNHLCVRLRQAKTTSTLGDNGKSLIFTSSTRDTFPHLIVTQSPTRLASILLLTPTFSRRLRWWWSVDPIPRVCSPPLLLCLLIRGPSPSPLPNRLPAHPLHRALLWPWPLPSHFLY